MASALAIPPGRRPRFCIRSQNWKKPPVARGPRGEIRGRGRRGFHLPMVLCPPRGVIQRF